MSAILHIHKTHRQLTGGRDRIPVKGRTVGECLEDLTRTYPGIREKIFDAGGRLRNIIEIYVNMESAYPDELAASVAEGDEIHVTVLLAGG